MKIAFFFGAGASYGAGHILPEKPPLGRDLFRRLCSEYPNTWGNLPEQLSERFEKRIEDGMEYIWNNHSNYVPCLMRDMGIFFSCFVPDNSGRCLYLRLIDELINRNLIGSCVFSTINYDCCFDLALAVKGPSLDYMNHPAVNRDNTLWKLHGSCNFTVKGIKLRRGPNAIADYTKGALFQGTGIEIIETWNVRNYCGKSSLYPCMSLYAPGKPNQMARATIKRMQKNWQDYIRIADKIVIIGAAPYPDDAHIWDYLSRTQAKILYIGARQAFEDWCGEYRSNKENVFVGERWKDCFDELIARI